MNTYQEFEYIENYYSGRFGEAEKHLFEQRLKSDTQFAARAEEYILASKAVIQGERMEMKKNLQSLHQSLVNAGKLNETRNAIYKIAAFIILLMGLSLLIYISFFSTKSTDKLFAGYFEPYPDMISSRGENNNISPILSAALASYRKKEYADAWIKFGECSKQNNDSGDFIILYRGISGLMAGYEDKAIELFITIRDEKSNSLCGQASWYLALSYLKTGDKDKARRVLKELAEKNIYNSKKAKLLLEETNK